MFVLDANTLIYFFKGVPQVFKRVSLLPPSQCAVPAPVLYELETGIGKSQEPGKRRRQLDRFLQVVPVLAFGEKEARVAAAIRVQLEAAGTPISPIDTLIAATAVAHQAVLVTRNVREFARVAGLSIENWYDP